MTHGRVIAQLVRADFLERTRRYSFLVTLVFAVYGAWAFLPANDSHYVTLQMGGHRGIYNSAWIGGLVAMMSGVFFSFAGFYLTKNAVERDRKTGVGEILAATPLGRVQYTLGKWLSNFAVLAVMVAVMLGASVLMQLARGEDSHLDLLVLGAPFVFITLPVMAVTAALAVLFETTPGLAGGFGNAVFFFVWIVALTLPIVKSANGSSGIDAIGSGVLLPSMFRACEAAFPGFRASGNDFTMGFNFSNGAARHLTTFRWEGLSWTPGILLGRLAWTAVGLGLATAAAAPFDRFDRARARPGRPAKRRESSASAETRSVFSRAPALPVVSPAPALPVFPPSVLTVAPRGFRFRAMLAGELRLALKGVSRWWWMVLLGLEAASAFAPLQVAAKFAAVAWLWPLLLWSALGTREARHGTGALLFSSAHPLARQLPAAWLSGLAIALASGAGFGLRLALTGHAASLAAWLAGAAFIPSFALGLGVWSASGKLFEVLYLLLWYAGSMNSIAVLDYTGGSGGASALGAGLAALTFAALAVAGRRRQLTA